MGRHLLLVCIISCFAWSCADKYEPFRSNYKFRSKDGHPDYANLDYWAAHPWKWDPSDSVPEPLRNEPTDSLVDVFFIHPTTYTRNISGTNASIDDDYVNAKSDYSTILYQASVFNQHCRVFSPRYRQASIKMFFTEDKEAAKNALAIAYADVAEAFSYYLEHWNHGRPIIIAGHSQGSLLAEKILKEFFEHKPLARQLVVAYVPGWSVPKDYFNGLGMCSDSSQTGCVCSWRTLKKNYLPPILKPEKGNSLATNPLNWTTSGEYASRKLNKGSILFRFNKVYPKTTDGWISNGILYVHKPRFPWSFLFFRRNYHVGDINLYYINLRENIARRIAAYEKR
jgi:hypothetical protein